MNLFKNVMGIYTFSCSFMNLWKVRDETMKVLNQNTHYSKSLDYLIAYLHAHLLVNMKQKTVVNLNSHNLL